MKAYSGRLVCGHCATSGDEIMYCALVTIDDFMRCVIVVVLCIFGFFLLLYDILLYMLLLWSRILLCIQFAMECRVSYRCSVLNYGVLFGLPNWRLILYNRYRWMGSIRYIRGP